MEYKTYRRESDIFCDGILPLVEKPSRYIDRELNLSSAGYVEGGVNLLLCFPDLYEIGMSHTGIRYLYEKAARMEGVGVEFAFSPWPDLEEMLRAAGEPLRSLQTGRAASEFDLIGISVPYELHYTNLLAILDLAGIPLEASERKDGDPLVIAGGPCMSNPLPILRALDAVFLGDGEESLREAIELVAGAKDTGAARREIKGALSRIDGVYVDGINESVKARKYILSGDDLIMRPIVPSAAIVHERLAVEVLRGCTRGCRFCHAGMNYRPRREFDVDSIVRAVCSGLDSSGWEEVSLLSLSTSDYSNLEELLEKLEPELKKRKVSLALPSLRPETVNDRIVAASSLIRRSGFTIAPEAGTERLRRVINKSMTDEEILRGCASIIEAGWQTLKLYFMIGLPTETRKDLLGISELVDRILAIPRAKGRFRLNISISPFVPKPNTPFQWERQCSMGEIREKEEFLSSLIRHRSVQLSMRDPRVSALEGVLARGDGSIWPVLLSAYRSGCRFDGWRDRLNLDLWEKALGSHGKTMDGQLSGFDTDGALPWNRFIPGVSVKYLLSEREKAFAGEQTPDCRDGPCGGCGACSGEKGAKGGGGIRTGSGSREAGAGRPVTEPAAVGAQSLPDDEGGGSGSKSYFRYRFQYGKTGRVRYLSHRELINIIQRALRRASLPLSFSEGFHPHPRISMGPSLAVGIEGEMEFFDIELHSPVDISPSVLDGMLPTGIEITECHGPFSRGEGKLPPAADYHYRIDIAPAMGPVAPRPGDRGLSPAEKLWYLPVDGGGRTGASAGGGAMPDGQDVASRLARELSIIFEAEASIEDRKGRRRACSGCRVERLEGKTELDLYLPAEPEGSPGPREILAAVMPESQVGLVRIRRLGIYYRTNKGMMKPIELVRETGRKQI